ncbi:MAG: exo-alpha-sialidase, partial [Calditrichaeota bacterium]|nr:exo-alpha-sialidase [Calditrichota bacterium]
SGLAGGVNGDLALTGLRQGTASYSGFRSNEFPHVAVNPVSGHLYVTYNNNPAGTDKADVYLVISADGGATWSAPVRVNDDATTTDQWQPTIAVTPNGAALGIFYYSREEDPVDNNLFKYYGRTGVISGATVTFTPSFPISDVLSLPEFGRDAVINSVYMGDYN